MTFFILSDFNKNNFQKGDKNERKSKRIAKTPDWSKAADCFYKGAELN